MCSILENYINRKLPDLKHNALILVFSFLSISALCWPTTAQSYFQQAVNYTISVSLNDERHELTAFEHIVYVNNSPDTLYYLYFHLWPNAYSNNHTALAKQLFLINGKQKLFKDPDGRGYIDSLDFRIDNSHVEWSLLPGQPDVCKILLNKPLYSGDSIMITTPFRVKIPRQVSRLGHVNQSYQISQWYPKPAVYDKNGWNYMSYLDQGEFYSEFGDYDVSITLPANYIVGASGDLRNADELAFLNTMAADAVQVNTAPYPQSDYTESSSATKTLRYIVNQVHDFAWFADKSFHVRKSTVKLPHSEREVTTWALFTNSQYETWKYATSFIDSAILHFSKWIGDFPYQNFVVVQSALNAGEGMEYPGLAVVGNVVDQYNLEQVITHEVCHSWFYSALGSNERRYPYMDEGITSAYEFRYMHYRYPEKKLWEVYFRNRKLADFFNLRNLPVQLMPELEWLTQARSGMDQPVNLSATAYTSLNYGIIVYDKAAMGFNYLRAYLGNTTFDAAMQAYYRQWQGKHPQPDDLRSVFEHQTHTALLWFFDDFLRTTERLDYRLIRYNDGKVLVQNNGDMVSPVVIGGTLGDSLCFEKWIDGFVGERWISLPPGHYQQIIIDPLHIMPEQNRLNNNIHTSGIFPKADPVRLQFLYTIQEPDNHYLMYIPSLGWTRQNGLMPGLTVYNTTLLPKKLEYTLAPFFTFKRPGMAGTGQVVLSMHSYHSFLRTAKISIDGSQFAAPGNQNYHKLGLGVDFIIRNSMLESSIQQKAYLRFTMASDLAKINNSQRAGMKLFSQCGYIIHKPTSYNPFSWLVHFEWNKQYQKVFTEVNYMLSYNGKDRGLNIRLFAASMLKYSPTVPFYNLALSGRSGRELYLYQDFYPDRFGKFPTTFWARQTTFSEGSIVSPINDSAGYRRQVLSLSFDTNLPGKASIIPVKPFIVLAFSDRDVYKPLYEAGFKAGIWNFFEVYVPLVVSPVIQTICPSVKDRIRIVLKLNSFLSVKLKPKEL